MVGGQCPQETGWTDIWRVFISSSKKSNISLARAPRNYSVTDRLTIVLHACPVQALMPPFRVPYVVTTSTPLRSQLFPIIYFPTGSLSPFNNHNALRRAPSLWKIRHYQATSPLTLCPIFLNYIQINFYEPKREQQQQNRRSNQIRWNKRSHCYGYITRCATEPTTYGATPLIDIYKKKEPFRVTWRTHQPLSPP